MARPERHHQTDNAADEEQPADEDCNREGGDWRDHDCHETQDHEDDAFDQKQDPMIVDRFFDRALKLLDTTGLIHRHVGLPERLPAEIRRTQYIPLGRLMSADKTRFTVKTNAE